MALIYKSKISLLGREKEEERDVGLSFFSLSCTASSFVSQCLFLLFCRSVEWWCGFWSGAQSISWCLFCPVLDADRLTADRAAQQDLRGSLDEAGSIHAHTHIHDGVETRTALACVQSGLNRCCSHSCSRCVSTVAPLHSIWWPLWSMRSHSTAPQGGDTATIAGPLRQ